MEVGDLSRDRLLELLQDMAKRWLAHDGLWFQAVERAHGMDEAIRACGRWLVHFHFCDSNRAAPGSGHVDFRPILRALKDIDYQGYFAMELLTANWPWDAETGREFHEVYPRQCIDYLAGLWDRLA